MPGRHYERSASTYNAPTCPRERTEMQNVTEDRLQFTVDVTAVGSSARAGRFTTLHNEVLTPVFMPVATRAVLRTQDTPFVDALGYPVLLANTYHLLLSPGAEVFKACGGIHRFMNWPRSVLTDSGGYQIFSLARSSRITEAGATFRSYLDGKRFLLSPEVSIETQRTIGSDIMMALDYCISSRSDESLSGNAVEVTARWAERSFNARGDSPQSLFGIVQGACFPELRRTSARQITSLPFDGFAIGGLAVGETNEERTEITELTASLLPANRPRYLMGVGTPLDLLEAVHRGVDMFDCILPTALAQQGVAFTSRGRIRLRRGVHRLSDRPLDEACDCPACSTYSRAYLHHLIKSGEYFGSNLVGRHNLTFYHRLMRVMRERIAQGDFSDFYRVQRETLGRVDDEDPGRPPRAKKRTETLVLGDYEIIRHDAGFYRIRQRSSGEIMHSVNDPVAESRALYAGQAGLAHVLAQPGDEFVIWDVGLGAGTNAMVALFECQNILENSASARRVRIVSFENDLDSFTLAVRNPSRFPHVRHAAPSALLRHGRWMSETVPLEWHLRAGDFPVEMMRAPRPDCIFFDPFSQKTNGLLWSYRLFSSMFELCKPGGTRLLTYSNSTRVRSSLLAAGFYVGRGAATGPKSETTIAYSQPMAGMELLGREWLERFRRSDARFCEYSSEEDRIAIEKLVESHPQFTI